MTDPAKSNDYVGATVTAAATRGIGAIDRSGTRAAFTCLTHWQGGLRFFPHGEGGGEFLLTQLVAGRCAPFFFGGREREDVHTQLIGLQEFSSGVELRLVFVGGRHGGVRARETMGMHGTLGVALVV